MHLIFSHDYTYKPTPLSDCVLDPDLILDHPQNLIDCSLSRDTNRKEKVW